MTPRDLELVRWIGRIGAATVGQVMARFDLSRSAAYRRVGACEAAGLLERAAVIHRAPALLVATHEGLRFAGLGLSAVRISAALANHHRVCGDVAIWLEREYGRDAVISVRELIVEESLAGRAIASARVGELAGGAPRLHRPDFAVLGNGAARAVEVELTAKAPGRLDRILRAWRRAECVDRVSYVCPPGPTRRAVEEAIRRTRTAEAVWVIGLEELGR